MGVNGEHHALLRRPAAERQAATFGERVEDIFYITDAVEDPLKLECLRYSISTALAQP